jgi:hypothetical protein
MAPSAPFDGGQTPLLLWELSSLRRQQIANLRQQQLGFGRPRAGGHLCEPTWVWLRPSRRLMKMPILIAGAANY